MAHPLVEIEVEPISHLDVTPWRAEDYASNLTPSATGQNLKVEAKLMKKFPPIFEPTRYMMKPCTILDEAGNFMLWYLPQAMTDNYSVSNFFEVLSSAPEAYADRGQSQTWQDMDLMEKSLQVHKKCKSWRISPTYFREQSGWLKPGSSTMATAWFQQGHEVKTSTVYFLNSKPDFLW